MSLLLQDVPEGIMALSIKICEKYSELKPEFEDEYNNMQKRHIYNDILYNLVYLDIAVKLNDKKIFTEYSVWFYILVRNLMKFHSRERVRDKLVENFSIMKTVISGSHYFKDSDSALMYVELGKDAIIRECANLTETETYSASEYSDIKNKYLDALMGNNTRKAMKIIGNAMKSGIKIEDIYSEILENAMHDVGNLWHKNIISVDKEHYMTSATQTALSLFYPIIYSGTKKNGCVLLSSAVESELHEMGIRIISDLFEYNGWDTIYLGAAVPGKYILKSIDENRPDLFALSVTMPHYLLICKDVIDSIRRNFPDVRIAVGGGAFKTTDRIWEKWDVDVYAENVHQLLEWADVHIAGKAGRAF